MIYPTPLQGAFYILAQPLVEHLYRGHEHLECFTNEDVTIGSWLMGVRAQERPRLDTGGLGIGLELFHSDLCGSALMW